MARTLIRECFKKLAHPLDKCTEKYLLALMGGRGLDQAYVDLGARIPLGASGNSILMIECVHLL